MANDNDDWEVAIDTGEFDKRLEQQEKARAANQEPIMPSISSTNDDDNRNLLNVNLMNSNKPIRILKRPTSQTQLPTINNISKTSNTNSNEIESANPPISTNMSSSSTTVPNVSIVQRIQARESTNSSTLPLNSSTSQTAKPAIKTYEQRELEYRLARLRIMGEEESSVKDDDNPSSESTTNPSDDPSKSTTSPPTLFSSISSTTRTTNQSIAPSQPPLQSHSTPGSYASNLYTLNNTQPTGAIHFTPHNNSTPNIAPGPYSSPNMPQNFRATYSVPYSHVPSANIPRYPLTSTNTNSPYMPSQVPYMNAPPPSSSSSSSSSYPYPSQQYSNMTTNNWYNYSYPSAPSGAPTFGHPQ